MQTIVRKAVILLYHWIVWFNWILTARKLSFRFFLPLDLLSLPPFHTYFQASSLCTLSPKQHLAWKNPYYSHQPERRKISMLNNQWWLLLPSLSYGFRKKTKKTGQHHICLFTLLWGVTSRVWATADALNGQRFPAIPSSKRQRREKFNTKEKICRRILFYLRWPKASDTVSRILWMTERHCCLSHSCCKRMEVSGGCRFSGFCHRKKKKTTKPVPHHCSLQARLENLNVFQQWEQNTWRKHTQSFQTSYTIYFGGNQ